MPTFLVLGVHLTFNTIMFAERLSPCVEFNTLVHMFCVKHYLFCAAISVCEYDMYASHVLIKTLLINL